MWRIYKPNKASQRKALMEPPAMMDSGVQVALDDESIEATAKRMKRETAVTGKSVVVLKRSDVMIRNGIAFMPNTIEMAQLKKQGKGQFKTNVQFSSKMTEMEVKKLLVETFSFLENQGFYCAAAVDNRTRLDFHGPPRIWDGLLIRRKIKGNSALYVLTDEDVGDGLDFKVPEQLTLKRSHDQITSPEIEPSEQSLRIGTETANISKLLTSFHVASHGSSILTGASAEGSTVLEKSGKSQQQPPEKMSPVMQFYVPVTAQHGIMAPVLCPSVSATHDTKNGKDVAVALAPLSQSVPLVMVQSSAVQSGAIPKARISTASDQQSVSKAADGSLDGRQAGFPLAVHKMPQVIPTKLTPQMNKLTISGGSPVQLQKRIHVEKTVRDQSAQTTECADSSELGFPVTTTVQSDKSFQVNLDEEAGTGLQHGARAVSSNLLSQSTDDQGEPSSAQAKEQGACVYSASERHPLVHLPVGMLVTDHEAGLSDSGVETSENIGEDASQSEQIYVDVATERIREKKIEESRKFFWKGSDQGGNLDLLSNIAAEEAEKLRSEATEKISIVKTIYPSESPLQGGTRFLIVLSEHLQPDVQSGLAFFGNTAPVTITRLNEVNMTGLVPASSTPGVVTVKVQSSWGEYLGKTSFTYVDEEVEFLKRIIRNPTMQAEFFFLMAENLGGRRTSATKQKKTYTEKPGNTETFGKKFFLRLKQLLGKSDSCEDVTDNTENVSDYDADDEASSTDSSEERDVLFNASDHLDSKTVNADLKKTREVQNLCLQRHFDGKSNLSAQYHQTQHTTKPLTLQDPSSETYCQTGDTSDESIYFAQMMRSMVLQTEFVSIKDNLEKLPPKRFHAQEGVKDNSAVMESVLNPTDVNENSKSDKSRRAQYSRRTDGMEDSPAADL